MCGIAGIAGKGTAQGDASAQLDAMLDSIAYRGPDDRGVFRDDNVALGHLRLSIIDTSAAGHQPMKSHDGRYVIVYNGEMFNYLELRAELAAKGATFATPGDTEVILEAYRAWGDDCLKRFNGMWAFALWDTKEKVLFCARDRFGVKPFFYARHGERFAFASEMKALLGHHPSAPDWQYLYHFFDRKTPLGSDQTVFKDIRHLRPGHSLTWKAGETDVRICSYWEYDPDSAEHTYDYRDPAATFRELFLSAVKLRLRSDVPVGICLSGGIDSSAIAMAVQSLGVRPHTFSSVYEEKGYGEAEFIDAVNAATGAEAHRITPSADDFFAVMDRIVHHHDEPVRMPGVYSHWHVMQCAEPHVTVLLDGQGADEVVGGYDDYFTSLIATLIRQAAGLRRPSAIAEIVRTLNALRREKGLARGPLFVESLLQAAPALRAFGRRTRTKDRLFTADFRSRYAHPLEADPHEEEILSRANTLLDAAMYRTFRETNLPMLLRYEDRNSMAFSLEARTPFLDYRLVEFCSALPPEWKMRGAETKVVVRRALADLLPPSVLARRDKKGFPTPVGPWFRGALKEQLRRHLFDGRLAQSGIIDMQGAKRLYDEHIDGKANHERPLFRLLTMELWMRQHPGVSQ